LRARVEIDDRTETVARKIREAEVNWTPFIGVIGDKELENGMVAIRERGISGQKEMKDIRVLTKTQSASRRQTIRTLRLASSLFKTTSFSLNQGSSLIMNSLFF